MRFKLVTVLSVVYITDVLTTPCIPRNFGYSSTVCVCNASQCHEIPPLSLRSGYVTYITTENGLRMQMQNHEFKKFDTKRADVIFTFDTSKRYQKIIGWGGAFTDATGININSLPQPAADRLLKSYYSKKGLEYNIGRVPMGGTDFSTRGYSYDDGNEDPQLLNFNLTTFDLHYKIPLIKHANKLSNRKIKLFGSAWTAPNWMKHNGKYTGPDTLKTEMYQVWANYFLKFLRAYAQEGIKFWGLTTGNEPSTGLRNSAINSVGWYPFQMGTFIAENLGPTIRSSEFAPLKLMAIDDNIRFFSKHIEAMFEIGNAKSYIDGFALHFYENKMYPRHWLTDTHNLYPNKFIFATEACLGLNLDLPHVKLGDWNRAEEYATDIILDMNHWVTGWTDWNMALDLSGGPTYIENNVDSPIIVNSRTREFYKQPMYYALGHFSKFLPEGSQRISFSQSSNDILATVFLRPDGRIVTVILNRNSYDISIVVGGLNVSKAGIMTTIPSKSIVTIIY